ncbi:post-GPI attachment to proteins factor 4-like [Haliotis rubra]|uniref:post-GPI attachment to proteins factor 4-like n=1 Tax=Haliotis rubra TaxID=36100 RepID=UPI001EE54ABD|nr:post-GPI attachment to proteins factor 4-like [Haliotis rubra]
MARSSFRRCVSTVAIVYMFQFLLLLPILCYNLPFSSYFQASLRSNNHTVNIVNHVNHQRVKSAYSYFKRQIPGGNLRYYDSVGKSSDIFLTVAIVTVGRTVKNKSQDLGYVLQTSAGIDKFAKSHHFSRRTFVFVCNVDLNPEAHTEAAFLKKYLPFSERYGLTSFKLEDNDQIQNNFSTYRTKKNESKYEKETWDYSYCLNVAKSFDPEYVLMVEDDAIPHEDLGNVLKYTLGNHLTDNTKSAPQRKEFAYLKLYYPERWQGYAYEALKILELVSVGCVGGGVTIAASELFVKNRRYSYKSKLSHFLLGMLFFILTAEFVGRQNIMEIRRLSKYLYTFRQASGCCTQAVLYPSAIVDPLTTYLTTLTSFEHTDISIYDFTQQTSIPTYQLEPNLFYHIGMQSTLHKYKIKRLEQFLFHMDSRDIQSLAEG